MNIFDRNRNDLSKYCYDLSRAALISLVAIPIFQDKLNVQLGVDGILICVVFLIIGIFLKKD